MASFSSDLQQDDGTLALFTSTHEATEGTSRGPPDYYDYFDDFSPVVEYGPWPRRAAVLFKVGGIVLLLTGIFGNVMTILVLRKMLSRVSAFPVLFMALAVTDLSLLCVAVLPRWIGFMFGYRIYTMELASCKLLSWLRNSLQTLSAWFLAAMTTRRTLSIIWPIRMKKIKRPRRQSVVAIAVMVVVSMVFNWSYLYGTNIKPGTVCGWTNDNDPVRLAYNWLELLGDCVLPSIVIAVCNCLMIRAVLQFTERGRQTSALTSLSGSNRIKVVRGALASSSGYPHNEAKAHRMSLTLIAVSLVFLTLTLPVHITYFVFDSRPGFVFWYVCAQLIFFSNSAVNFYLYVLTASRFRKEANKIFGSIKAVCIRPQKKGQYGDQETEMHCIHGDSGEL